MDTCCFLLLLFFKSRDGKLEVFTLAKRAHLSLSVNLVCCNIANANKNGFARWKFYLFFNRALQFLECRLCIQTRYPRVNKILYQIYVNKRDTHMEIE